jgi:hypothetical protein
MHPSLEIEDNIELENEVELEIELHNPNPPIDPYNLEEMRIPRRSIETFDRYVINRRIRPQYEFVYRVDRLLCGAGTILETIGPEGHKYRNRLENIFARANSPQYLREMVDFIHGMTHPRGHYYFLDLDGARRMQWLTLNEIGRGCLDSRLKIYFRSLDALLQSVSVVTRVRSEDLPAGWLFADRFPQDSPKAAVHIVDGEGVVIPNERIQIFADGEWKLLTFEELEKTMKLARHASFRRILTF